MTEDVWLAAARRCASPNCNDRPLGTTIDLVVIHGISLPPEEFGGPYIDQLFSNTLDPTAHPYFEGLRGLTVSAHLLIRRDGELVQYVPLNRRAWHAGQSCWQGRDNCNDFSVGIELEGTDEVPYTEAQYRCLVAVVQELQRRYPTLRAMAGHSDIAPGRKTDPGPSFDWLHFGELLDGDRHDPRRKL